MYTDEKENETQLNPPVFDDLTNQIAETIRISRQSLKLATNPFEAAQQIIELFEKQANDEKVTLKTTLSKTGTVKKIFVWPYAERVKYLLLKFLSSDHRLQNLIVAAREDNIFWRGDEFDEFVTLIDQYEKMRSMPKGKYRKQSFREMRGFIESKTLDANAA